MDVDVDEARDDQRRTRVRSGDRCVHANVRDRAAFDHDLHVVADRAADPGAPSQPFPVHKLIFPRTVGRAPVAPATFVSSPITASFAMIAIPIASFAWLWIPRFSCVRIRTPGSSPRSIDRIIGFNDPPPPTTASSIGPRSAMKSL